MHRIALMLAAACAALALPVCGLFKKSARQARRFSRSACSSLMYSRRFFLGMLGGSLAGWLLPSAGCTRLIVGESSPAPRYISTESIADFNAKAKANPNFLNNRTISNARLNCTGRGRRDGVVLENMVIRNLTLRNVQMLEARWKNVTFVDCKFIKTRLDDSEFFNVKFIRGSMAGYAKPTDSYEAYETSLYNVYIDRVLFDGMYFDKSISMKLLGNGIVVMRNCTTTPTPNENTQSLLKGTNLHVRMNNCQVQNQTAIGVQGDNSSAYVTNSTFTNSNINVRGRSAWIENCIIQDGAGIAASEIVVIKKCTISGVLGTGSGKGNFRAFLVDNNYRVKDTGGIGVLVAKKGTKNSPASIYIR